MSVLCLFPEWLEQHKDDPKILPGRIRSMYNTYGRTEGETCRSCAFFVRSDYHSHNYFKCRQNRISHGPGTDWRAGWAACGKWEKRDSKKGDIV